MEYHQIFTDIRVDKDLPQGRENLVRLSAHEPDGYGFPYLLRVEHGLHGSEENDVDWQILYGCTWPLDNAKVVRYTIKVLDDYKLGKKIQPS